MSDRTMVYVYDHIKYPAQITFNIEGDYESSNLGAWDDEAENMLINLFNDEAKHWHLNTCMEYVND